MTLPVSPPRWFRTVGVSHLLIDRANKWCLYKQEAGSTWGHTRSQVLTPHLLHDLEVSVRSLGLSGKHAGCNWPWSCLNRHHIVAVKQGIVKLPSVFINLRGWFLQFRRMLRNTQSNNRWRLKIVFFKNYWHFGLAVNVISSWLPFIHFWHHFIHFWYIHFWHQAYVKTFKRILYTSGITFIHLWLLLWVSAVFIHLWHPAFTHLHALGVAEQNWTVCCMVGLHVHYAAE